VAQQVFALLARRAGALGPSVIVSGWLYRTTCYIASQTRRREIRRHRREQLTAETMNSNETDETWRGIEPWLDEAMSRLSEVERDAVVLRYFENKSLREVGAALGINDDAAQKRLSRAVERLRGFFTQRGKTVAAGALTAAVSAGAIQAAPAALAGSITSSVLAGTVCASATVATLKLMTWTTLKPVLAAAAALGAAGLVVLERTQLNTTREANERLQTRLQAAEQAAQEAQARLATATSAAANDPRVAEIARLRGELVRARQEQTRLASENQRLRQGARSEPAAYPMPEASAPDLNTTQRMGLARLNYTKCWGLALMLYADKESNGKMPDHLEQAIKYFPKMEDLDPNTAGSPEFASLQPDQFELMYQGSLREINTPASTILLREKDGQVSPNRMGLTRAYLFADGHSEIHFAPDGNFDAWEKERLAAPKP
jgi:RNA polymerase sigma factor (sigma-70 family)